VTSDNPRTENPQTIIDDVRAGIQRKENVYTDVDRRSAITKALAMAQKGDVVLIAGKGHEDYQVIGTTKHHFSDREIVSDVIAADVR
jgi:UDP-N-acetylmuramoyl-L-alanyl-D-glutamate--2,6-diaminopimelate ligase